MTHGLRSIALRGSLCLAVAACGRSSDEVPVVPRDMSWITRATDDPLQWRDQGFIELVQPVRPPTTTDGTDHIVAVLSLPGRDRLAHRPGPALSFDLPVGTVAARIEYAGPAHQPDAQVDASWRVLDVRQFEWTTTGVACAVLRPDGEGHLVGLRWSCGETTDARAGEVLARFARGQRFAGPRSSEGRERQAQRLRATNTCRGCHQSSRPEDRATTALVQRGTDGSGLFSLAAVFRDEDPVERYRPVDANTGDPWMSPVCPGSAIDVAHARCVDGLRPRLAVDIAAGLRAGDPHVTKLCRTRRQLAARFDDAGRAAVAGPVAACGAAP